MLIFISAYGPGRLIFGLVSNDVKNEGQSGSRVVPSSTIIGIFALFLGVAIFVMRVWLPINSYFKPLGLPMTYVPQYIALFFVGVIAYRGD